MQKLSKLLLLSPGEKDIQGDLQNCQYVDEQIDVVKKVRPIAVSFIRKDLTYPSFFSKFLVHFSGNESVVYPDLDVSFLVLCFYQLPIKSALKKTLTRYERRVEK